MADAFDAKARWFDDHYGTTRGRVRRSLVLERLDAIMPPPPARVLDAGGGSGAIAVPLAERGYDVTLLDPSEEMVRIAQERAASGGSELTIARGTIDDAPDRTHGVFDVICCHTVLLYLDDPVPALTTLRSLVAEGAVLSLLEKNRDGLSMRPGWGGDYAEAARLLDDPVASGNLGIPNRSRSVDEWTDILERSGWSATSWVGIRLFSDAAPDDLPAERFDELLDLEREAGRRASYRSVARLIHLAARAG